MGDYSLPKRNVEFAKICRDSRRARISRDRRFFTANVELPAWSAYVSPLNVVLFALPTIWALKMWLGLRDGLILFAAFSVLALLIESSAIATGFPYGHFGYSNLLGWKVFGLVPWTVAFAWPPLMIGAYSIARRASESRLVRIALAAVMVTVFDVVIDPGAVKLGFWRYAAGGEFYGVPWSNFGGWMVSGVVGAGVLELFHA